MSNIVKCFKKKIIFFSRELFEAEQDDLGEYEFFDFFLNYYMQFTVKKDFLLI